MLFSQAHSCLGTVLGQDSKPLPPSGLHFSHLCPPLRMGPRPGLVMQRGPVLGVGRVVGTGGVRTIPGGGQDRQGDSGWRCRAKVTQGLQGGSKKTVVGRLVHAGCMGEGLQPQLPGHPPFQVHKFLDKNHDQVRQDVLDLFVRSRTRVSRHPLPGPGPAQSTQPTARPLSSKKRGGTLAPSQP